MGITKDEVDKRLKEMGIEESKFDRTYFEAMRRYIIEMDKKDEVYNLYKKMTPSMQKAILDIMKTVNGMEIDDDRTDDIQESKSEV